MKKIGWIAVMSILMNVMPLCAFRGHMRRKPDDSAPDDNVSNFLEIIEEEKEPNNIPHTPSRERRFWDQQLSKRRNQPRHISPIIRAPRYSEDLPPAEAILPGHTLLRPARGMLKSAVKYPLRDVGGSAVYGNPDNVGITWGKTRARIRYSNFRKANNLVSALQNAMQNKNKNYKKKIRKLIVIEIDPSELEDIQGEFTKDHAENQVIDEENEANEIIDDSDDEFDDDSDDFANLRRTKKTRYRDRSKQYERLSKTSTSDSTSSELEKNTGNPFTIYKNKYKQNWLWNHMMDGDHMNINPYAPGMTQAGPSGADLFFGRKWWYFNQDDYKPLRRR